jgi:hypothetical protein
MQLNGMPNAHQASTRRKPKCTNTFFVNCTLPGLLPGEAVTEPQSKSWELEVVKSIATILDDL